MVMQFKNHIKKHRRRWIGIVVAVLIVSALGYVFFVAPVRAIYLETQKLSDRADSVKYALAEKDLELLQAENANLNNSLLAIEKRLQMLGYLSVIPLANIYYQDANNLISIAKQTSAIVQSFIEDISPYGLALGLKVGSEDVNDNDLSLESLVRLMPQLVPAITTALTEFEVILPLFDELHYGMYPNFSNFPLRDIAAKTSEQVADLGDNFQDIKSLVNVLPDLMGVTDPRQYLVLFQNDKELRPTGGFITSYAVVTVNAGDISISDAKNIYEVSSEEAFLPPPEPIVTYLKQPLWRMRDTNFSPDFKNSIETFLFYWDGLELEPVQGVVTIDTQFVSSMLRRLGPIEVTDYSYDFSAYSNLPESCKTGGSQFTHENVVCRLEVYAQRLNLDQYQRKAVIGDLMEKMFEKIMQLPSEEWYPLWEEVRMQFNEKHLLTYLKEPAGQAILEDYNWAGRVQEHDGDYLYVNDSNLAGLKSDMYLKRSVKQKYEIGEQGEITKTVTLRYENTGEFDGWLNATARNYLRVYVPQGSELLDVKGSEVETTVQEELGKTVFDNFLQIPPLEAREIEITYKLPIQSSQGWSVLIQKQPGVEVIYHTIEINGEENSFELRSDRVIDL